MVPTCLACLTYPTANAVLQSNTLDVVLQVKLVVCFLFSRDHDYDTILTHIVSHPADLHLMMPLPFCLFFLIASWDFFFFVGYALCRTFVLLKEVLYATIPCFYQSTAVQAKHTVTDL